jgi:hypothetical protein
MDVGRVGSFPRPEKGFARFQTELGGGITVDNRKEQTTHGSGALRAFTRREGGFRPQVRRSFEAGEIPRMPG